MLFGSASVSFRCRSPGAGGAPGGGPIWNQPLRQTGSPGIAVLPYPPGQRLAQRKARNEKQGINAILHPVCPPQSLCGAGALRSPENGAGPAGPSTPAAPLRTTPVFAGPCADGARFGTKRFLFHRSGGDFSLTRQRKVGPESPGTSRYPLPARKPFKKERIHHGTEI